jgi:hypothetical protein
MSLSPTDPDRRAGLGLQLPTAHISSDDWNAAQAAGITALAFDLQEDFAESTGDPFDAAVMAAARLCPSPPPVMGSNLLAPSSATRRMAITNLRTILGWCGRRPCSVMVLPVVVEAETRWDDAMSRLRELVSAVRFDAEEAGVGMALRLFGRLDAARLRAFVDETASAWIGAAVDLSADAARCRACVAMLGTAVEIAYPPVLGRGAAVDPTHWIDTLESVRFSGTIVAARVAEAAMIARRMGMGADS